MSDCTANVAGQDYADFIYRHNAASLEELADWGLTVLVMSMNPMLCITSP